MRHVRVEGFRIGITFNQSTDVVVQDCSVCGAGAAGLRIGIATSETGLFRSLLPGEHMTGPGLAANRPPFCRAEAARARPAQCP